MLAFIAKRKPNLKPYDYIPILESENSDSEEQMEFDWKPV